MKLYFVCLPVKKGVGIHSRLMVKHKCKVLSAYPFCINKDVTVFKNDFFLDSGAFSVHTGKVAGIDIDKYIEFIKRSKIKVYAGLDVIGNAEQTKKNCEYMIKQGLNPIPTFHYGSDFKYLKDMVKKYSYIAIGGMAGEIKRKGNELRLFLNNVFAICKNKVKLHGFGITGNLLLEYPFYSVDSTGWLIAGARGSIALFKNGRVTTIPSIKSRGINKCGKNIFTTFSLSGNYIKQYEEAIKSYLQFEKYLTALWKRRGIVWND